MRDTPADPQILAAGFFCLRTHLLPFDLLTGWSGGLTATATAPGERDAALEADRRLLRDRLRALAARPEVREALFVASPPLHEAIEGWLDRPDGERGRRVERTLTKYFARLAARPTPFGLFAAVATGRIDRETAFCVSRVADCRRHTRLDNEYLFTLASALGRDPAIGAAVRYVPNDSLHFAAGVGRYVEARPGKVGHTFHLVAVDDTVELRETIARAGVSGGASRAALADALVNDVITREEAEGFVDDLIASQLLVSDLGVPVTGPEPAGVLASRLADIPAGRDVAERLHATLRSIERLDALPPGQAPASYREIAAGLAPLPVSAESARLFQVDLVRPSAGILGTPVVQELQRGAVLLHRLTPAATDPTLERFAALVEERYNGRAVPLLEALDEEAGLGGSLWPGEDPSPLVRGLPLHAAAETRHSLSPSMLLRLHQAGVAAAERQMEWRLDPAEVEQLSEGPRLPLPHDLAAFATLAASDGAAVTRGEFQLHLQHLEPGAARLLGRFCHADPGLTRALNAHLRAEEACDAEALHAEVVHLPEGRLGNILLRPVLREWEITYLGQSGAPRDRQIPASDLMLEVCEGRLVLSSRALGRRIVPRLASAHNAESGLTPYRFLTLLQYQDVAPALRWEWGAAGALPFLPRVTHGRLVLALARWRLSRAQAQALRQGTPREQFDAVQAMRSRRGLPRWVVLVDGDHRLPVDLDNALAVEALLHELADQPGAILEELWPEPERLLARGPEGAYRHELVVPLRVRRDVASPGSSAPRSPAAQLPRREPHTATPPRRFPPGSEWLYLKLYSGPAEADELLDQVVGPLSREFATRAEVRGWFFIRYADPESHLRWRIRSTPATLWREIWPAIQDAVAPRISEGRIWRAQLDTYDREVERYGGPEGMELAERIFQADSEAVVDLLGLFDRGDAGLEERWRTGVVGVDRLFHDFGLNTAQRLLQLQECARYGSVPEPGGVLRHQLSERFRTGREELETLLDPVGGAAGSYAPAFQVLAHRTRQLLGPVTALTSMSRGGSLGVSLTSLLGSVAHLHLNRLLRGAARAHETVVYDFLRRVYESRMRRAGRGTRPTAWPAR